MVAAAGRFVPKHLADFAAPLPARPIRPMIGKLKRPRLMQTFFVQIKCHLGKTYEVAERLADMELHSEIYSTAGDFDLLVKYHVDDGVDVGHFVGEKVQVVPGIEDTRTVITFKAF
jgi:DNA-binding Lrp family transcriptional regulator